METRFGMPYDKCFVWITQAAIINTVDSFQGQEADIVLISLAKSTGTGIGFAADDRRANVLLSRSSHLLIVFGNSNKLIECSPSVLSSMARYASDNACMFEVSDGMRPLSPYVMGTPSIRVVRKEPALKMNARSKVMEIVRASPGYIINISRIGDILKKSGFTVTGKLKSFICTIGDLTTVDDSGVPLVVDQKSFVNSLKIFIRQDGGKISLASLTDKCRLKETTLLSLLYKINAAAAFSLDIGEKFISETSPFYKSRKVYALSAEDVACHKEIFSLVSSKNMQLGELGSKLGKLRPVGKSLLSYLKQIPGLTTFQTIENSWVVRLDEDFGCTSASKPTSLDYSFLDSIIINYLLNSHCRRVALTDIGQHLRILNLTPKGRTLGAYLKTIAGVTLEWKGSMCFAALALFPNVFGF